MRAGGASRGDPGRLTAELEERFDAIARAARLGDTKEVARLVEEATAESLAQRVENGARLGSYFFQRGATNWLADGVDRLIAQERLRRWRAAKKAEAA